MHILINRIAALATLAAASSLALSALPATAATEIVDSPYPGEISLRVDLTDTARKIFNVREVVPVKPGPLTLSYPKWIPGEHGATGPIDGVTGLKITANGARISWRRDLLDMYSIDLDVPAGATSLTLEFQFLSPVGGGQFGAGVSASPRLAILEWNQVLFYPAGYKTDQVTIQPTIKLPSGWGYATALEGAVMTNEGMRFKAVSVDTLVDSALMTGLNFKQINLTPGAARPVRLNIVGDRAGNLEISEKQIKDHQALVKQAQALFGAEHYDHYDFLLTLSEKTNHFGLEHHQSSDNRASAELFTSPTAYLSGAGLLPHEYVHSWNGKFRRPGGLATPNFSVPMKGELLWVYEGLTTYLGQVLTARAGMWTAEQYRDAMAITAADMDHRPGRAWRPLRDTADQAQVLYTTGNAWSNYRRSVDFYPEGNLLWLDIDTKIREMSGGKKTLDSFLQIFHGNDPDFAKTSHDVKPYEFNNVVATLNQVQPADWAAFLRTRLDSTEVRAPLDGVTRGGWKLIYTDTPTELFKAEQKERKLINLMYSIGLIISNDSKNGSEPGQIIDVLWNSPAFEAGMSPNMKIIAINGEAFDGDVMADVVKAAAAGKQKAPIELMIQNQDYYSTIRINYQGGAKYPRLERVEGKADLLTLISGAK